MRCNIINPALLTDQHLIAERRELRMIPPLFEKRLKKLGLSGVTSEIPDQFTLGKGHMLFWMNKGVYLQDRHRLLTNEMLIRGFSPDLELCYNLSDDAASVSIPFAATPEDYKIIVERILDRVRLRPEWYRRYSIRIDVEEYAQMLLTRTSSAPGGPSARTPQTRTPVPPEEVLLRAS